MHKPANSKKAITVPAANPDNYKSESSKPTAAKGKEGLAAINMKDFKCEIDHEIAKCLDTLDRQGLKFLKETLRASKIFGLNTQELGLTQPVEEHIDSDEDSPPKPLKDPKKIEPKNNTQTKKTSKVESSKKPQAAPKPTNLNEKINKRLEGLNIKTGKKTDPKAAGKKDKPAEKEKVEPNVEIVEEIEVEEADSQLSSAIKQQPIKGSEVEKEQPVNPSFYESAKSWTKKESAEEQKGEDNALLKPFCKKQFKKHHEDGKHHKEHKDYGIEISKPEQFRKQINDTQQPPQLEEDIYEEVEEPVEEQKPKEQTIPEMDAKIERLPTPKVHKEESEGDPNIQNLIIAIGRLSPSKRNKLERIIEKLQNSDKCDATSSFFSNPPKNEPSYQKPYIAQRNSFAKISEVRENNSKSRSKLQKVEKATSLKSSLVRRIPTGSNLTPENHGNLTPTIKKKQAEKEEPVRQSEEREEKQQPAQTQSGNILEMYDDVKSQVISQSRKQVWKAAAVEKVEPRAENSKELQSSNNLSASNLSHPSQSGQKLIKIGKKKGQPSSISFKILTNNGHSSLVGLTSIQIFNLQGETITVEEANLRQPSPKLLKLFNESVIGEGWFTTLSNATIFLDNITQQIGGIRIVNWNKSELEADRQADLVEIWINEQLHWRGQLKGGSYKDSEVYATNIKVTQKHFDFPPLPTEPLSFTEDRSTLRNQSVKNVQLILDEPKREKEGEKEACWLEKETVERQLKQLEEEERKDEKIKKIGSIRNTVVAKSIAEPRKELDTPEKQFEFNWLKEEPKEKPKDLRYQPEVKKPHHDDDILGELSRGLEVKRKKEESISVNKKKEENLSRPKEEARVKEESASKKHQEYLLKKEKEQDEEFEKILLSMGQRSKPEEEPKIEAPKPKEVSVQENKGKLAAEKNFEDFMKDSLFDEKPMPRKFQTKTPKAVQPTEKKPDLNAASRKNVNLNELDDLIDELNDVVGEAAEETGEEFFIPELPVGRELSLALLSNWGNPSQVGLNGIELFDVEGECVRPVGVSCSGLSGKELFEKLFKQELLTSDEKAQVRFPKGKRVAISLSLPERTQLAAIRLWNYNGHRVHNNIGVRKVHIKLDGVFIFSGEIQQSSGSSEDAYKYCEYILFTDSAAILKRISEGDWLSRVTRREEEERLMFRTTLEHFHRPLTRNDEEAVKKQEVQLQRQPVKLPKRLCAEYDPPTLPQGFVIKLVLHSSWGDCFFIGLNGIEVFSEKGENITTKNLVQIRADPSSIAKLEGYERDKRVVGNLINGVNNSASDANSWLAPLLSDLEKIEKGKPNVVLLEYSKPTRIAAINFYNYAKTPERGVREIEIFMDSSLLYRGYLRKHGSEPGVIHTTVNFTREQGILEAVGYAGYNEDHLEQEVGLVNEEKVVRAGPAGSEGSLVRPMTGKIS